MMKRYTVYELGARGPQSDRKAKSFWFLVNAQHETVLLDGFGIYDNRKQRWV